MNWFKKQKTAPVTVSAIADAAGADREAYRVSSAKSEEQTPELLEQGFVPDRILLDITMPRMDEYAGFIRSLP
ncbi:response regulator [Breznakiellaceae bacterium SP9]